jgi:hypothetical protein
MPNRIFTRRRVSTVLMAAMLSWPTGFAMTGNATKYDDESPAMSLRRATRVETVSSDIALRLAEMLFVRHYGEEQTNEQLPLVITDRGDKWEVHGREGSPHRLIAIIRKTDGRILELALWR